VPKKARPERIAA